jgi:speckle-type POZ protein
MDLTNAKKLSAITSDGVGHRFRVNYSAIKRMKNGEYISSPQFTAGPLKWVLICYPRGCDKEHDGMVSLYLKLLSECFETAIWFDLVINRRDNKGTLSRGCGRHFEKNVTAGFPKMIRASDLEEHYVSNGHFILLCTINFVVGEKCIDMPREHTLLEDIKRLSETNEMADVRFSVEGEIFSAHRVILGSRSKVFKAELFGSMAEREMNVIPIKDMQAVVFKALLNFIYTDSLPNTDSIDMILSLMVAGDRYAIEGLANKCQERLLKYLSTDTVLDCMILADRHNYKWVKETCLNFASKWENFVSLAVTEDYAYFICNYPSLVEELQGKIKQSKTRV